MDISELPSKLHPQTREYIESTDVKTRKQTGEYFTPPELSIELLKTLPQSIQNTDGLRILDPASGTGEFLRVAENLFENPDLHGWELNEELADISTEVAPDATITVTDTLTQTPEEEFDLIIGNPPYYEMDNKDEMRDRYGEIMYGRTNIYALFIYKSLQLLHNDGYLAFVNPPSMNNGAYFKELRSYIINNCSIENLEIKEDTQLFSGANQSIMLLTVYNTDVHNDYVFTHNDISIFSTNAEYLTNQFEDKYNLRDLGYEVQTGKIPWNQYKDELSDSTSADTIPLVWSKNICNSELVLDNHEKPQYIEPVRKTEGPAIVVNRVVGQPGSGSVRAAYIEPETEFVAENHVNVITADSTVEQRISFEQVLDQLNNPENIDVVQSITGNSQLSKTELEQLFPFSVN
jgi:adenine-specific DNA-methyltransferase